MKHAFKLKDKLPPPSRTDILDSQTARVERNLNVNDIVLFHRRGRHRRRYIALIRGCDRRRFIRRVPCQVGVSCSSIRSCVPEFRLAEVMISQPAPWQAPTETSLTALTFSPLLCSPFFGEDPDDLVSLQKVFSGSTQGREGL